jgi:DNA ligase-1
MTPKSLKTSDMVNTPQKRALWAMYSGPFKLTPAFNADPVNALPFEGRGHMTQKMDGMYALWDGKEQMYTRGRGRAGSGNRAQHPPAHFAQRLPPVELEGELCYSSGEYSRGHSAKNNNWANACLWVFDAPLHPGSYEERWQYLNKLLADYDPRVVRPVPFLGIASSRRVLNAALAKVRATAMPRKFGAEHLVGASYDGGEGVMIRDPDAKYTYSCFERRHHGHKKGQTASLYKWLEEYGNDECLVIAPHAGHTNSLRCSLPNGAEFVLSCNSLLGIPASDIQAGSIITFTYRGWSSGLPLDPCAQAFRTDRVWSDIVASFIQPPSSALRRLAPAL